MTLNPYFTQGTRGEQGLIQDLINEQLRMYGVEIYYIPRKYLTEKTGVTTERAKQIAYLSEGNISKAVALTTHEGQVQHEWFANWMRMAYKPNVPALIKLADEFDGMSKEDQKGMMEYGLNIFRDLLLWKNGAEALVRLEGEELTFVQNFSKAVKVEAIELIVQEFSQVYYYLEQKLHSIK